MNETDLDRLLSQPLPEPADDGFSARVLARVAHGSTQSARLEGIVYGIVAAVVVAALTLTGLGDAIARVTPELMRSQPLALAVAALVITGAYLRWSWER